MVGMIPQPVFMALFGGALACVVLYLLCVLKLRQSLLDLKRRGRALEAPEIQFSAPGFPGVIWLLTGRYATLGDEAVTRWSTSARTLLLLMLPLYVALFGNVIMDVLAAPKA